MGKSTEKGTVDIETRVRRHCTKSKPRNIDLMPSHIRAYFADAHAKWKAGKLGGVRNAVVEALSEYLAEEEKKAKIGRTICMSALRNYLDGDKP